MAWLKALHNSPHAPYGRSQVSSSTTIAPLRSLCHSFSFALIWWTACWLGVEPGSLGGKFLITWWNFRQTKGSQCAHNLKSSRIPDEKKFSRSTTIYGYEKFMKATEPTLLQHSSTSSGSCLEHNGGALRWQIRKRRRSKGRRTNSRSCLAAHSTAGAAALGRLLGSAASCPYTYPFAGTKACMSTLESKDTMIPELKFYKSTAAEMPETVSDQIFNLLWVPEQPEAIADLLPRCLCVSPFFSPQSYLDCTCDTDLTVWEVHEPFIPVVLRRYTTFALNLARNFARSAPVFHCLAWRRGRAGGGRPGAASKHLPVWGLAGLC